MSPVTDPYQADAPQLIARTHRQLVRAQLSHPSVGVLELPIAQGAQASVAFDESRAPRVELSATVPLVEGLSDVDPRTGWRVQVQAGYVRDDDTEDVAELCDLFVRKTPRDWAGATLGLAASSDECLVIDAAPAVAETLTGSSPNAAFLSALSKSISPMPYVDDPMPGSGSVSIDPVEDRWAALQDLADRQGVQVYDDGTRTWHATASPVYVSNTVAHTLTVGEGGTVLEPTEDVDRDAWANYVVLRYRWRTSSGADAQVVATAYAADGPYAITGPAGRRIFRDDREVSTSQAAANAAAQAVLARQLSRASTLTIRAVSAYWLRPGHTVSVALPSGTQRVLVSRVVFNLHDGTMTLTTRRPPEQLPTIGTTTPPPDPATPTTPKPATADPAPPAKNAYVTEWPATATAVYRQNGVKRSDVTAGDVWQGAFSGSYNGNQRSIALFTGANSVAVPRKRSETGKTIDQALTGVAAGDLTRVELIATVAHAWAGDVDVVLGYYDGAALPATAPRMAPYVTSRDWPVGSSRTVNITSAALVRDLLDGSCRAVTFGPGPTDATSYYGKLQNVRLRLSYAK